MNNSPNLDIHPLICSSNIDTLFNESTDKAQQNNTHNEGLNM